jgi:N-acetylglucosamine malate deacetylase 1
MPEPTNRAVAHLRAFGRSIGLAFQIVDDILDVTQTSEQLGKTAGKDTAAEKATYPSLFGVEQSERKADELVSKAFAELDSFGERAETLKELARFLIRETKPRVVILPYWKGRHPDHYTTSVLGYEACFLAGLAKLDPTLAPHRPFKIVYATLYYDVRPTFVVDISEHFEGKFASILAYKSQFSDQEAGKDLFPAHDEIRTRVDAMARYYGMLGGVTYAEPFLQKEVGLVEDLLAIPVKSI